MSPTGDIFRQQVDTLLDELSNCIGFCNLIQETRRLGSKHENFDNLQNYLHVSHNSLSIQYDTLSKCFGHRMDAGDEASSSSMNRCLRALKSDIKKKLYEIAHKRKQADGSKLPGFKDILQHWQVIEKDASSTMINLSQNLIITPPAGLSVPASTPPQQPWRAKEFTAAEEFDFLLNHMKNSWTEKWSNDRLIYVNYFDEDIKTFDKPDAFIRTAPTSYRPARMESPTPSRMDDTYDRPRRSRRDEFWG